MTISSSDFAAASASRIACITDTYGLASNNGVGRFLHDLLRVAGPAKLRIVAPGKQSDEPGLHFVRAPSFAMPGYRDIRLAAPLDHQRKAVVHDLKRWRPDVIHVSTPGPFGCFGVSAAQQLSLPLVGVYHTDFPKYAAELARTRLVKWRSDPSELLRIASTVIDPAHFGGVWGTALAELQRINPRFEEDLAVVGEILRRNWDAASEHHDLVELGAAAAAEAAAMLLCRFYDQFTLVVARSPSQYDCLRTSLKIAPERLRTLTPGVDAERFHPCHRDRAVWDRFGVSRDAFVLLYVGRRSPEKNFDFLLRVWTELRQAKEPSDREFRLVVVGSGDHEDNSENYASLGLHYLGPQTGEALSALYASADLLLFPSETETLGQVGLEAAASGLPAIVSDQGGPAGYVQDGVTGRVLPTSDVEPWVRAILEISRDDQTRGRLGENARQTTARDYSLEASVRNYWEIHAEAVALHAAAKTAKAAARASLQRLPNSIGQSNHPGLLIVTDYHAGKRFASAKERRQKEAAFAKMMEYALEQRLRVVFGGDFGDHGARGDRLRDDFEALRRVRKRLPLPDSPIFVRGNHDYGFSDEQLVELTGGCAMHSSLVYFDKASGVAVTHGHILSLPRVAELFARRCTAAEAEATLTESALDEDLKPSVIAYDLAHLVESFTQRKGLTGLSVFWEGFAKTRATLAHTILQMGREGGRDKRTWKMVASLIGSHNDVELAGLLGATCGAWASLFGHTHEPLVRKLSLRQTPVGGWTLAEGSETDKSAVAHLVANAGNINRKRPSCVVARYPEVRVLRYDRATDRLETWRQAAFAPTQAAACPHAPAVAAACEDANAAAS